MLQAKIYRVQHLADHSVVAKETVLGVAEGLDCV